MMVNDETAFEYEAERFADDCGNRERLLDAARGVIEVGNPSKQAGANLNHWTAKIIREPKRIMSELQAAEAIVKHLTKPSES